MNLAQKNVIDLRGVRRVAAKPSPQPLKKKGEMRKRKDLASYSSEFRIERTKIHIVAPLLIFLGSMGLVLFFARSENYLAALLFFLIGSFFLFFTFSRKPRRVQWEITQKGIRVSKEFYPYAILRSFWIFDEREEFQRLSIRLKKTRSGAITIPLADREPKVVRGMLEKFLREKKREESFMDIFTQLLGL